MKAITTLSSLLFLSLGFSKVSLDIDFKHIANGKEIDIVKSIDTDLNIINSISIPETNQVMELKVSHVLPEDFPKVVENKNSVLVDMKLYKVDGDKKEILSSPQIITIYGQTATMETFDTYGKDAKPVMSLKVLPRKE